MLQCMKQQVCHRSRMGRLLNLAARAAYPGALVLQDIKLPNGIVVIRARSLFASSSYTRASAGLRFCGIPEDVLVLSAKSRHQSA